MNKQALPFVKWVGGKRAIIDTILKHLPKTYNNYYEPFLGGGYVYFTLKAKRSYISDINQELIRTYKVIRANHHALKQELLIHSKNNSKEYFYKIRSLDSFKNNTQIAARFIYLNRTCFNGLYRVNTQNKFNTPFGSYPNPLIYNPDNIDLCHAYLKNTSSRQTIINHKSFLDIKPKKNDFVYLDPPYYGDYIGYNPIKFNQEHHLRLKKFCDDLNTKKVKFMLSNSNTQFIKDLYADYCQIEVECKRGLKGNQAKVSEVLIKNY